MHVSASDEPRLYREGIDLFNDGEWFEAHEVWEDIWHLAEGRRKKFYQGLIQCAVTLEHARRGNPRGVRSVWATCVPKFEGMEGAYLGIDVRRLIDGVGSVIQPVLDLPDRFFDPALPRGQVLPVDWAAVPKITLSHDPFA